MTDKNAFEQKQEAKIEQMNAEIERLKAKAKEADAESRIKYQEKVDELEALRGVAKTKLDKLKQSSESAWTDISKGLDEATMSLATAIKNASQEFKS